MAKYGKRIAAFQSDNDNRVSTNGKAALITEIIHVVPTSDAVTLYNRNGTAYTGLPTAITTGAAICQEIMHLLHAGVTPFMVTGAPTTTTSMRPVIIKYINGPTTLATIYAKGFSQAGGSGISIVCFGKLF